MLTILPFPCWLSTKSAVPVMPSPLIAACARTTPAPDAFGAAALGEDALGEDAWGADAWGADAWRAATVAPVSAIADAHPLYSQLGTPTAV